MRSDAPIATPAPIPALAPVERPGSCGTMDGSLGPVGVGDALPPPAPPPPVGVACGVEELEDEEVTRQLPLVPQIFPTAQQKGLSDLVQEAEGHMNLVWPPPLGHRRSQQFASV